MRPAASIASRPTLASRIVKDDANPGWRSSARSATHARCNIVTLANPSSSRDGTDRQPPLAGLVLAEHTGSHRG